MIQTVIFDLDDTLYSFAAAHRHAMPAVLAYAEKELDWPQEDFARRYEEMMDAQRQRSGDCAAIHNRYLRFQMMLEEKGLPLRHVTALNDLYWHTLLDATVPNPGVMTCVQQLKAAGVRIGIGTDMTVDWQLRKLEKLQLLDQMDFVVSSEEASAEKPKPQFFDLCRKKAGCPKEGCLFIGDNLRKDVLGALDYGFHALWYQPDPTKVSTHPEVEALQRMDDLPRRLGL